MTAQTVLIEASPGEVRGALLRDGAVWDVVHHRDTAPSRIGAAYRGRVRRIEPGINGAFVDLGLDMDAFLRARDAGRPGERSKRKARIGEILHEGAAVTVRVVADAFAEKGPRVVRIDDPAEGDSGKVPSELVSAAPPAAQILDRFTDERLVQVVCNDAEMENQARAWVDEYRPGADIAVERGRAGLFAERGVDEAVELALSRRVRIAGGAELVFDQAEALCVVDINSAGAQGKSGRAARDTNLKAMPEIARQLRLRNIAGAIVIDALKMGARDDQKRVLDRLRGALRGDPGGCHVLGLTNLGLVEVTRTRIGPSLAERLQDMPDEPAPSAEAVAYDALRAALRAAAATPAGGYRLCVAPDVADLLDGRLADAVTETGRRVGRLDIVRDPQRVRTRFEVMLGSGESPAKA
ncbi:MAG: ribonuclease E/G [Alphaproteobacteria bacterium]|nr:ribonuclease E/G [Alphaproteobacteria bacterium]